MHYVLWMSYVMPDTHSLVVGHTEPLKQMLVLFEPQIQMKPEGRVKSRVI